MKVSFGVSIALFSFFILTGGSQAGVSDQITLDDLNPDQIDCDFGCQYFLDSADDETRKAKLCVKQGAKFSLAKLSINGNDLQLDFAGESELKRKNESHRISQYRNETTHLVMDMVFVGSVERGSIEVSRGNKKVKLQVSGGCVDEPGDE